MGEGILKVPHLEKVLMEMGEFMRDEYKNNLNQSGKNASLNLYNSIEFIHNFGGNEYWIGLQLEDYWKYIEYGTKPHFPPTNKILEWIKVKPILPTPDKNGKLPTEKQLAFLISRKISQVGTQGVSNLEDTVEDVAKMYEDRIMEAITEDLGDTAEAIIKTLYDK